MTLILSFIGFLTAMSFFLRLGYVKGREAGRAEVYSDLVEGRLDSNGQRTSLGDNSIKKGFLDLFSKKKEIDQQ